MFSIECALAQQDRNRAAFTLRLEQTRSEVAVRPAASGVDHRECQACRDELRHYESGGTILANLAQRDARGEDLGR